MGRFMRFAFLAVIAGVVAGALVRQRERLIGLLRGAPPIDTPGDPPLAAGRFSPDVDFAGYSDDSLTEIRGIGPRSEEQLKAAGINTYEKLADLSAEQVLQVLSAKPPGADIESWIEQAIELAEERKRLRHPDIDQA